MQCDDHSFLDGRPAQCNRVVLHLDVDVRRAAIVSAREDGLKGGQAIGVSHDQAPQESQLIGLACHHPTRCNRPCITVITIMKIVTIIIILIQRCLSQEACEAGQIPADRLVWSITNVVV